MSAEYQRKQDLNVYPPARLSSVELVLKLSKKGSDLLIKTLEKQRRRIARPGRNLGPSRMMAGIAILLASFAFNWNAQAEVLISRYDVSLGGLHVGDVVLRTTLSEKHYNVEVWADVGAFFDNKKLQGVATGSRAGGKLKPDRFQMTLTGGGENAVDIRFAGAAAKIANITPPFPERLLAYRVPLTPAHLRGVFDPLSAILAASLKPPSPSSNPCHEVLAIFTGYARFDVSLSPKPEAEPTERAVVTCQGHYVPVAGHLRTAGNGFMLEIAFRRLGRPRLWLIEHVSLPTPMGVVTVARAETKAG